MEELQACGVDVVFVNRPLGTTPEDQLLLQVQGVVAEFRGICVSIRVPVLPVPGIIGCPDLLYITTCPLGYLVTGYLVTGSIILMLFASPLTQIQRVREVWPRFLDLGRDPHNLVALSPTSESRVESGIFLKTRGFPHAVGRNSRFGVLTQKRAISKSKSRVPSRDTQRKLSENHLLTTIFDRVRKGAKRSDPRSAGSDKEQ